MYILKPNTEFFFKKLNFKVEINSKDILEEKEVKAIDVLGSKNDKKVNNKADFSLNFDDKKTHGINFLY